MDIWFLNCIAVTLKLEKWSLLELWNGGLAVFSLGKQFPATLLSTKKIYSKWKSHKISKWPQFIYTITYKMPSGRKAVMRDLFHFYFMTHRERSGRGCRGEVGSFPGCRARLQKWKGCAWRLGRWETDGARAGLQLPQEANDLSGLQIRSL